ncbi:DUF2971 domain-containing protein [Aeromonas caviae]|uniref:DUF2971 domain-containing protein n=1 Tax=Aeromonas caviae TaxID=648 RepID=UPI00398ACFB0
MNPDLKEKTSLICFTKDKILSGNHLEDMPLRGFCKPRMWAQYAGNHSGVCLIFDESLFSKFFHEQFNDKTYSCRDVIYCVYRSSYHLTPASNRCLVYATLVRTSFGINFRPFLNML